MTMDSTPDLRDWTRRPERGSEPVVRFMVWLSLAIGRPASRPLVRAIAL